MLKKKLLLLALALLLLPGANLRPCWQLRVDGRALEGLYSTKDVKRALRLSQTLAEELLPEPVQAPRLERRLRLRLHSVRGDLPQLSDALLRAYPGIVLADGVFVNGVPLGTVRDRDALCLALRDSILDRMPDAAVVGSLSGQLRIRPVYSRAGHETNDADMVLLISGMAPVIYLDREGRLA